MTTHQDSSPPTDFEYEAVNVDVPAPAERRRDARSEIYDLTAALGNCIADDGRHELFDARLVNAVKHCGRIEALARWIRDRTITVAMNEMGYSGDEIAALTDEAGNPVSARTAARIKARMEPGIDKRTR